MNKSNKKRARRHDREKTQAVAWCAKHFEVSPQYVYGILNGQHTKGRSGEIERAFKKKYTQLKKILS